MKWYVYFRSSYYGRRICHCFEQNEKEARWFAEQVNGELYYGY